MCVDGTRTHLGVHLGVDGELVLAVLLDAPGEVVLGGVDGRRRHVQRLELVVRRGVRVRHVRRLDVYGRRGCRSGHRLIAFGVERRHTRSYVTDRGRAVVVGQPRRAVHRIQGLGGDGELRGRTAGARSRTGLERRPVGERDDDGVAGRQAGIEHPAVAVVAERDRLHRQVHVLEQVLRVGEGDGGDRWWPDGGVRQWVVDRQHVGVVESDADLDVRQQVGVQEACFR